MNGRVVFLGLLLICVAADARKSTEVPRRPACTGSGSMCPMNFEPVCGDNGETYPNECVMCVRLRETNSAVMIIKNSPCQPDSGI
ncbi:serine protease inhibitor Kazal-type 4 isoform X2 [Cheilinus undulatus]|uniref:serine protease inhibitor Kazal-type 4 isoform X1 n=1 Tax=Cheilinus undulatus TaxID=241271 RepID=UPI001BD3A66E|nr:serine protease inhibitor Kazal-type 4 isoform X1 [Cheilinus undulatus]XP_041641536.1 serine protease inhibitor Kazal-type 4 isoform X2 [Cheilinus undulatus]